MLYMPVEIENVFKNRFEFPKRSLYGSVATLQYNTPNIRTMRVYEVDQEGCPILLTHTQSAKWGEFVVHPWISVCMISEDKTIQVILKGVLKLDTLDSEPEKTEYYWSKIRPDVQKIYDPRYSVGKNFSPSLVLEAPQYPPDTLGIVRVIPSFWETLELSSDYIESQRTYFSYCQEEWIKERVNVG